jgi:hypothetical protein
VGSGKMAVTLEQWYRSMPVVTRSYLTLSFLTTAGCALELISPFSVYYNSHLIFRKYQVWRLFTNFFFFGSLGMDFVFHMFFLSRYCRLLEEGTFRGRSADFFYMLLFGSALLSCVAPFINIQFLGASLTFMMVYVWGRGTGTCRCPSSACSHSPRRIFHGCCSSSRACWARRQSSIFWAWPRVTCITSWRMSTRR